VEPSVPANIVIVLIKILANSFWTLIDDKE